MPGIFGGIGARLALYDMLEHQFSLRWNGSEAHRCGQAIVGGHAFASFSAVHPVPGERFVAIDGEWGLYDAAEKWLPDESGRLIRFRSAALEGSPSCVGNLALLDPKEETLHLAVDSTGSFPLYYAEHEGGLLFSSLLRPLAQVIAAQRDDIATLQFLRQAYTLIGRTPFLGITRLLPGQSLRYRAGEGIEIHEQSRAWTDRDNVSIAHAAEAAWSSLSGVLRAGIPSDRPSALMMSAGWDSRTLLAGMIEAGLGHQMTCYSHGDTASRELRIVERTCRRMGVRSRLEPIDDRVINLDRVRHGFDRVENVVFPHWHRAGRQLAESGVACITAGVYGEVLGGHYGPTMLGSSWNRMSTLAGMLLRPDRAGARTGAGAHDERSVRDRFRLQRLEPHWYLDAGFETTIPDRLERMNADIDRAIARLERRGIMDPARLVEAFITEHRGTQYINAQLLSCRVFTDIALPFATPELFSLATAFPLSMRIHNRLNRRILEHNAPSLLRDPLAATLLPAAAPIPAQEISRVARKMYERIHSDAHRSTRGKLGPPRLGWVNFDFLRTGRALSELVDDLRSDIWDRTALRRRIIDIQSWRWKGNLHSIFDQFSKIYTIDLMLRG